MTFVLLLRMTHKRRIKSFFSALSFTMSMIVASSGDHLRDLGRAAVRVGTDIVLELQSYSISVVLAESLDIRYHARRSR